MVEIIEEADRLVIRIDGQEYTQYHYGPMVWKPYLYPLRAANGLSLLACGSGMGASMMPISGWSGTRAGRSYTKASRHGRATRWAASRNGVTGWIGMASCA